LSLVTGKPDDAIGYAQDVWKTQPGLTDPTIVLTQARLRKGDAGSAERGGRQLARDFPASASVQTELGQLYALKHEDANARTAFERALAIDSKNIEALAGLTAVDIQAKKPAAASARVDAGLTANPNNPQLLLLAARL